MSTLLALATTLSKDPPLIDLDSTVFLQLGLFIIVGFLLSRLLFRPYLAVRAAREQGIEGARDEATRLDEEAQAKQSDYESRLTQARQGANLERQKLRVETQSAEQRIHAEAAQEVGRALDSARTRLETETDAARKALEPRIAEIAGSIAAKVLGREVKS